MSHYPTFPTWMTATGQGRAQAGDLTPPRVVTTWAAESNHRLPSVMVLVTRAYTADHPLTETTDTEFNYWRPGSKTCLTNVLLISPMLPSAKCHPLPHLLRAPLAAASGHEQALSTLDVLPETVPPLQIPPCSPCLLTLKATMAYQVQSPST